MRLTTHRWLTVRQAAAHFQVEQKTLYSLIARHQLPGEAAILRFGRQIRIAVDILEAAAEQAGRPR